MNFELRLKYEKISENIEELQNQNLLLDIEIEELDHEIYRLQGEINRKRSRQTTNNKLIGQKQQLIKGIENGKFKDPYVYRTEDN